MIRFRSLIKRSQNGREDYSGVHGIINVRCAYCTLLVDPDNIGFPVFDAIRDDPRFKAVPAGKSLSDYVREELAVMMALPSEAEIRTQLEAAEPFAMKASSARIVRAERDTA